MRYTSLILLLISTVLAAGAALMLRARPHAAPRVALARVQPPVVPVIDARMKERLRTVYLRGQGHGNNPDVFVKVGDSITATQSFLAGTLGCADYDLAGHTELQPVIDFFRARTFPPDSTDVWCGVSNSFSRVSRAAESGWASASVLEAIPSPPGACGSPFNIPLACEIRLARPSVALVMFGTNDLVWYNIAAYRANLEAIVARCIDVGVIPVLSTIPPRLDDPSLGALVRSFNEAVVALALEHEIPLWNYWLALQGPEMVNDGLSDDGVHPGIFGNCDPECLSGDFSGEGLRYGYNVRNYTALQVLDRLWRVVIANGEPDPSTGSLKLSFIPESPAAGGGLTIEVEAQPIGRAFDAWAVVRDPSGVLFSFTPAGGSRLIRGARPLARGVEGLASAVRRGLFHSPALPPGSEGRYVVTAGLVPAGETPSGASSAIPGYADTRELTIR